MKRILSQNLNPNDSEMPPVSPGQEMPSMADFSDNDVRRFDGTIQEVKSLLAQIEAKMSQLKQQDPRILYENLYQQIEPEMRQISFLFGGYLSS